MRYSQERGEGWELVVYTPENDELLLKGGWERAAPNSYPSLLSVMHNNACPIKCDLLIQSKHVKSTLTAWIQVFSNSHKNGCALPPYWPFMLYSKYVTHSCIDQMCAGFYSYSYLICDGYMILPAFTVTLSLGYYLVAACQVFVNCPSSIQTKHIM